GGEVLGGLEGAVAVAQQHAYRPARDCRDNVELAVPVDVRHRHLDRDGGRDEVLGGLEGAVAVAQQHTHPVVGAGGVGRDEIEVAVAIHVGYRQAIGIRIGGDVGGGLEGAVAVAEEHADVIAPLVGSGNVEAAVAVDVGDHHIVRVLAGGEV